MNRLVSLLTICLVLVCGSADVLAAKAKPVRKPSASPTPQPSPAPKPRTKAKPKPAPAPSPTPAEKTWEQEAIDSNIAVSEFFDEIAESLDLLLAGKKVTKRTNESRFQVENTSDWTEGEGFTNSTGVGVHLRLPNFEETWKLKFSSYDEQEENRSASRSQYAQIPRRKNPGASVGWFQNMGKTKVVFQPRVELKRKPGISHSLAFYQYIDVGRHQILPRFELFANQTLGTGVAASLNFSFELPRRFSLALLNDSQYAEKAHLFSVSNGFSVGHPVGKKAGLGYSLIFGSNNRPRYHLDNYSFAVTWSHTIYKRILDYRVIPHLDFAKARGFEGRAGITLSIVLNF